jgi:hypothetical protein
MGRRTEWYEEQAEKAPWRGTVNGREAYIDRWKGKYEICCRVQRGASGLVMFRLDNKAAIRNLAEAAAPPLPEALVKKAMKSSTRDEPIRRPRRKWPWILLLVLAAAAAYLHFFGLPAPGWTTPVGLP